MDAWLVALIGIQMAFTVAIIAIVFKHYNARAQRRAELQARILEKFESPRDLSQFLESSEGRNLVSFLAPAPRNPRSSLVSGAKSASVLFFLGLGFAFVGFYVDDEGLMIPAFICLGLAVGIGVAAVVGHRLTKEPSASENSDAGAFSDLSD